MRKISLRLNKMLLWSRKHWKILLLLFITLVAYGQSIRMYFWVDDWGLTYKMIFPYDAPNPSNFGGGFWGSGAYRHNATPFIFLYPLFGLSATVYFGLGILQYFFLAWLIYKFLKYVSGNETISLMAGVIFASGYIGSYAIYRLNNSYQLIETAIFSIFTAWAFIKHFRTGKTLWYWLSLLLFIITIEFFFLRAHGIVLIILISFIFAVDIRKLGKRLIVGIAKLIPFILIYYFAYVIDYRGGIESGGNNSANYISTLFNTLVVEGNWGLLGNLIASFANMIIPLPVVELLFKNLKSPLVPSVEDLSKYLGAMLLMGMAWVTISAFKAREKVWRVIPMAVLWTFSNIIIYFIYMPTSIMVSSSRYVIPAFVGSAMVSATFIYLLFKKKVMAIIMTVILSLTYLVLTNIDEAYIVRNVSIPDKQGYALIQKDVAEVDENTLFLIEAVDDPVFTSNILGNIPDLGISSLYRYRGSTRVNYSYEKTFEMLSSGEADIEKTYTFFFSRDGYINTTERFRDILRNGNEEMSLTWGSLTPETETFVQQRDFGMIGVNPTIEIKLDYPSLTPSILTVDMALIPYDTADITYPYFDYSSVFTGQGIKELNLISISQQNTATVNNTDTYSILKLAKERNDFMKNTKITSTNYEQNKKPEYLKDGTNLLGWEGNYIFWRSHGNTPEEVIIDLGIEQPVNNLYWINHSPSATPVDYSFSISKNNKDWTKVIEVEDGGERGSGEMVVEKLDVFTKYIKMDIFDTSGDSVAPAIDELWISKDEFAYSLEDVDSATACPFCFTPDKSFAEIIVNVEKQMAEAKVWWQTDGLDNFSKPYSKSFSLNLDGKVHRYVFQIPAGGSKFRNIRIGNFPIPLRVDISGATIKNMSMEEINKYYLDNSSK